MKTLPVGIQLYGLRDVLEEHPERLDDVASRLKKMGFDGVELAGLYGMDPADLKTLFEKHGLVPISAHVPLVDMMEDLEQVLNDYSTLGVKYLVVPYLPEEYRHKTDGYEVVIEEMTKIGEAVAERGMRLLYHNHDFEFVVLDDGTYGLDDIYNKIPEGYLAAEPDTCWIEVAGEDAPEYIRKLGSRAKIIHLKDFIKIGDPKNLYELIGIDPDEEKDEDGFFEFRPVGFGQQIWEPILQASLDVGADWVIVEQDEHYDVDAMEAARRSITYLKILGW